MKRVFSVVAIMMIGLSLLPVLTTPVTGWSFGLHSEIARDALEGLGWTDSEIGNIPWHANEVDLPLLGSPHGEDSCHRVEKYQRMYEDYGGEICPFPGAEWFAAEHLEDAHDYYAAGNIRMGRQHLGYAIHYIEDSVCPSHIFPFEEDLVGAHLNFELYTLGQYLADDSWSMLVRDAAVLSITGPEDLRQTLVDWADEFYDLLQPPRCSYRAQDGTEVGTLSWIDSSKTRGWKLSDADIGITMAKAASIIKGAANWVLPPGPSPPAGFIHGIVMTVDGEDYYLAGPNDGPAGQQDVPGHYWMMLSSRRLIGLHYNVGPFEALQWWSSEAPVGMLLYVVFAEIDTWSELKAMRYARRGYVHYHELVEVSDGSTKHPLKVVWLKHRAVRSFSLDGGPHPEFSHYVTPGVDYAFIPTWDIPYP